MEYILIILIVLIASFLKGITGFGFALVSFPPLLIWYSPVELIPVLIICNLAASIIIVLQKKEQNLVNKKFTTLILYGAAFTFTGVLALKYVPDHIIIKILGAFFVLLSIFSLVGKNRTINYPLISYKIAGAILGFLTGSISISGPPLALFLNTAKVNNQEFREIFAWFSIVTSVIALTGYGIMGLLNSQHLEKAAIFLPILFLGSFCGKRINKFIPVTFFKKSVIFITLVASILLLFK